MTVRELTLNDIDSLRKIHNQYFKDEFDFPSFMEGFNSSYLVEHDGQIVVAGGIRPIAEVILMTNKSLSDKIKVKGLKEFLNVSKYIGDKFNYDSLHAFVTDEVWKKHLIESGFIPTKGQSILYHL